MGSSGASGGGGGGFDVGGFEGGDVAALPPPRPPPPPPQPACESNTSAVEPIATRLSFTFTVDPLALGGRACSPVGPLGSAGVGVWCPFFCAERCTSRQPSLRVTLR